jgi:hypothetical protein
MKVGFYTSLNSTCIRYQIRDLMAGFAALGHEVDVLHEESPWSDYGDPTIEHLLRFVEEWKPDVMLQMNGNRFHHPPLPETLPWVNVAIDRMPWLLNYTTNALWGPRDLTCACFAPLVGELQAAGQRDVRYLPIGYNAGIFTTHSEPFDPRFHVDIAFLCHLPRQEDRLNRIALRWDALAPALWLARHEGVTVGLYGAGWDQWAETAPYYRGNPTNGPETHALYQQARLHIHSNEDMIIHMRLLECLGSGGSVALYTPQMFFNKHDANREGLGGVLSYKCVAGLKYALEHAVHREWPVVRQLHGTKARACQILAWLKEKGAL